MERETGFEPATSTLARLHSTAELFPRRQSYKRLYNDPNRSCQEQLKFVGKHSEAARRKPRIKLRRRLAGRRSI
jgi:hypothetical protein